MLTERIHGGDTTIKEYCINFNLSERLETLAYWAVRLLFDGMYGF